MDIAYNRKLACAVLAVCVLGSTFGLGGGYLIRQRAAVQTVFNNGTNPDLPTRSSVDAYLEKCGTSAATMANELKLRVNADDADAARALEISRTVGDGNDLSRRYAEYTELNGLVESMYNTVYAAPLKDDEREDFKRAYYVYKSEAQKIGFDAYHTMAEEYNKETKDFPASIVSKIVGASELNPF